MVVQFDELDYGLLAYAIGCFFLIAIYIWWLYALISCDIYICVYYYHPMNHTCQCERKSFWGNWLNCLLNRHIIKSQYFARASTRNFYELFIFMIIDYVIDSVFHTGSLNPTLFILNVCMSWNWLNIYVHIKSDDVHTVRLIYSRMAKATLIYCAKLYRLTLLEHIITLDSVSLMCNLIAVAIEQDSHWFI